MRLCRLRGALSSSASASSSPSVHPGASSGLSANPTSTEVLKPLRVLGSAGFGELRTPGVGFANLGATPCPASVRLLWAGRFGASFEKVDVSYRQFSLSVGGQKVFDSMKSLINLGPLTLERLRVSKKEPLMHAITKVQMTLSAHQLEDLQLFTGLTSLR